MITIVSSTNRPSSKSLVVARIYQQILNERGVECQVLSLSDLPHDFAFDDLYGQQSEELSGIISRYMEAADKFVFIIPEYNGSFPGILKAFLDGIHPRTCTNKKAGIIGLSDGRAGNLRGQEHLTGILHYMKVFVHYSKPKLSVIDNLLDADNRIIDAGIMKVLEEHAGLMIEF